MRTCCVAKSDCYFFFWSSFRSLDVTLDLKDPHYPDHNLGSLELAVTLAPKEGDIRETVSVLLYLHTVVDSCFSSFSLMVKPSRHVCFQRL